MPFAAVVFIEVLASGVLAYAAAASILPFSLVALCFWAAGALEIFRVRRSNGQRLHGAVGFGCSLVAYLSVLIAAAAYVPAKTIEQYLDRQVVLDSTSMSLQQLDSYCSDHRERFPTWIYLAFADNDKDIVVRWPSEHLTLREFVQSIESQTGLRHRFLSCGNGWTLLHGADGGFGLQIRDRK